MKFPLRPAFALFFVFVLFAGFSALRAAPVFQVPGFVDEEIYKGNGMISVRFDSAGRMWVTEKQGRVLVFAPNDGNTTPFNYEYYESAAAWSAIPDFNALTPVASGTVTSFTLQPRLRDDNFGLRFTGSISVPAAGSYTFYLTSDDGSRLYIDATLVVNHDGPHGSTEKSGSITLSAGTHTIKVEYFEAGGGESLTVQMEGPGMAKAPISKGPFKNPLVFANLVSQVNTDGERGMTGLALDPDFANNHYLYVLYATNTDQHISRLTANTDFTAMVPGSELVLLSGLPNTNNVHKAGDMAFHPNDPNNLYIMIGDDGDRTQVSDLNKYNGKILKISAADGKGLPSNPYYNNNDNTTVRSRVWSHRYRNPFRFTFDPAAPVADVLYISENGDGTDRTARIEKGADGGWDNAFTTDSADGKRKILATSGPSRTAIAIIRGGPFAPDGPVLYNARFNTSNGGSGELYRSKLTGANLDTLTPVPADGGGIFYSGFNTYIMASMQQGPDGAIYYTDSGQGPSTGNNNRLGRLRFVGGSAPVADFSALPSSGSSPLNVAFTDASTAPGSTVSSWTWNFGDGTTSSQQNPSHIYAQPGVYTVTLTVTNALGLTHSKETTIKAYAQTTINLSGQILDGRSLPATNLGVATDLRFYQKDGSTPLVVSGGTGPDGNILAVPAGGSINVSLTAQITGNAMVVSAGESSSDGVQSAYVGIPLSTSLSNQSATANFRLSDTMIRGRILDTKGIPALVDLGISRANEGAYYAFAGGRDFLAGHAASGVLHRLNPDVLGYYHVPVRTGGGNALFYFDTSADSLTTSHGRIFRNFNVNSGESTIYNPIIGLYDGGTGETDLSGIAETANINFAAQIQPIFTTSCAACHNDIATNSGGLDLQSGAALGELVGQESTEAPGVKLVEPGRPERSYLMEKINASIPQKGTSMRPGDPMPLAQRALIRDWIKQLNVAGKIQFTGASYSVQEGSGSVNATITLERSGGSSGTVGVTISTVGGGNAQSGSDYTSSIVELAWLDGETGIKSITVPVLADALAEGNETVSLQADSPSGGAILGTITQAVLTIQDRPFDSWRFQNFGSAANDAAAQPSADFDNDGFSNLMEYALALNPLQPQASGGPAVSAVGNRLQMAFTRNTAALGLVYNVEASDTLASGSWEALATKTGAGAWITASGVVCNDSNGNVVVADSRDISAQSKRFLRLIVDRAGD